MASEDELVNRSDMMTVVVSHHHFIHSMTGLHMGNVGAVLQSYRFTGGRFVPVNDSSKLVFKGYDKIKAENLLNHHYSSCRFMEDPRIKEIVRKNEEDGSTDAAFALKSFFRFL